MGVCDSSMFCCTLLYVHSSIAIILMGKRELVAWLNLSSGCLVMVKPLFLTMPRDCLRFVIVVLPDHTHLLFLHIFKAKTKKILPSSRDSSELQSWSDDHTDRQFQIFQRIGYDNHPFATGYCTINDKNRNS